MIKYIFNIITEIPEYNNIKKGTELVVIFESNYENDVINNLIYDLVYNYDFQYDKQINGSAMFHFNWKGTITKEIEVPASLYIFIANIQNYRIVNNSLDEEKQIENRSAEINNYLQQNDITINKINVEVSNIDDKKDGNDITNNNNNSNFGSFVVIGVFAIGTLLAFRK